MILRTDFSSTGILPKILTALLTPFSTRIRSAPGLPPRAPRAGLDRLSDRQLRDIGIELNGREVNAALLLADLVPRSALFGPRRQRWQ